MKNNATVLLNNPKNGHNVGGALRAASCYGVKRVVFTGDRVVKEIEDKGKLPREERMRGFRDVQLEHASDPWRNLSGTPVAVELRDNAEPLFTFDHPDDAVYVFGPEDGSLTRSALTRCHRFIVIPTYQCLNLASAVYTVLYDRAYKHWQRTGEMPEIPTGEGFADDDLNLSVFAQKMGERLLAGRMAA